MRYQTLIPWILLPLIPLIVGFVLLGVVDHEATGLRTHLPVASGDDLNMRFFNALLPYLAIALFHVAACGAVIVFLVHRLRDLPKPAQVAAWTIFAVTMVLLGITGIIVRTNGNEGALNLGYRYVCTVLSTGGVAGHIVPVDCFGGKLSRLALFALLPVLAGLIAAALASAVTSTAFTPLSQTDPAEIEAELQRRSTLIDHTFKSLSFVLVTSTLSLLIFYRLPLALIDDPDVIALWTGYAQAITLYWGTLFTLTLLCIFGPGTLMLGAQLRGVEMPQALRPQATRQQIANILTTLAPLLLGASGSILETLAGAL